MTGRADDGSIDHAADVVRLWSVEIARLEVVHTASVQAEKDALEAVATARQRRAEARAALRARMCAKTGDDPLFGMLIL